VGRAYYSAAESSSESYGRSGTGKGTCKKWGL
jgi:hypothetical protein